MEKDEQRGGKTSSITTRTRIGRGKEAGSEDSGLSTPNDTRRPFNVRVAVRRAFTAQITCRCSFCGSGAAALRSIIIVVTTINVDARPRSGVIEWLHEDSAFLSVGFICWLSFLEFFLVGCLLRTCYQPTPMISCQGDRD